jgi:hypothetical protein
MYGIDQKSICLIIVGSQVEKFAKKRQILMVSLFMQIWNLILNTRKANK